MSHTAESFTPSDTNSVSVPNHSLSGSNGAPTGGLASVFDDPLVYSQFHGKDATTVTADDVARVMCSALCDGRKGGKERYQRIVHETMSTATAEGEDKDEIDEYKSQWNKATAPDPSTGRAPTMSKVKERWKTRYRDYRRGVRSGRSSFSHGSGRSNVSLDRTASSASSDGTLSSSRNETGCGNSGDDNWSERSGMQGLFHGTRDTCRSAIDSYSQAFSATPSLSRDSTSTIKVAA